MGKYDVVVLGGGPGGYVAAIRAAQLGAKVALIEQDKVGGTCLNRGCIPTKAILACASLYEKFKKAESYGLSVENISFDLSKIIDRKEQIVAKLVKGLEFLIEKNGITIIYGKGRVVEPGKVEIEKADRSKQTAESSKIILATGSIPATLPHLQFDGEKYLSSDDALRLRSVPEKLDIVGGGVVGIHFASIFSTLGTAVTIYEALPEILIGIDEEVVASLKRLLKRKKVNILTNTTFDPASSCGKTLLCVGRTPNLNGLENLKLKMNGKSVWVNDQMETSVAEVYAVGDLVSQKMLAHVAYEQGEIAAENALGGDRTFNYDCVPYAIYTSPEIGCVGLNEEQAKNKYGEIKIGRFNYAALGIAQAMGEIEGFIKVMADKNNKVIGIHIIGAEATTLIGSATLALKQGLTIDQLAKTFQAHPSFPEGLQEASFTALGKGLHSPPN